mmetsp:Transcript_8132/g.19390  ORF Transcript_8132/g.19390 Transcript_8132/m.19390 type:complete len:655 (+) Transcript_8132:55-2019(+)
MAQAAAQDPEFQPVDFMAQRSRRPPPQPLPPEAVQVAATVITIRWHAPIGTDDEDKRYKLWVATDANFGKAEVLDIAGTTTMAILSSLEPRTRYFVKVACITLGGEGPASQSSAPITTLGLHPDQNEPPTPEVLSLSSVKLTWKPPNDNGLPVTGYQVFWRRVNEEGGALEPTLDVNIGAEPTVDITNLKGGARYVFGVAARNEEGLGPVSDDSVAVVMPAKHPDKPPPPTVTPEQMAAVTVRWSTENDEMLDPTMTGWKLRYSADPDMLTDVVEHSLQTCTREFPIVAMDHGKMHYFQMCFTNGAGDSEWSDPASCVPPVPKPPGKPAAPFPRVPVVDHQAQRLEVRWSASIDAANRPFGQNLGYSIRVTWKWPLPDDESERKPFVKEYEISGNLEEYVIDAATLECYKEYRVQIRAANVVGWGEWSDPSEVFTVPPPVPRPVGRPTVRRPTHHSFVVQWPHPNQGGAHIESFRIRYSTDEYFRTNVAEVHDVPFNLSQCGVKNLSPGTTYWFQVCATNRYGVGVWGDTSLPNKTLDGNLPAQITTLTVPQIYNSFVLLQWEPAEDNGYPITKYVVRYSKFPNMRDAKIYEEKDGSATTCAVKHIKKDEPYYFQVCAQNAAGGSEWSNSVEVKLPPKAPRALPDTDGQRAIEA